MSYPTTTEEIEEAGNRLGCPSCGLKPPAYLSTEDTIQVGVVMGCFSCHTIVRIDQKEGKGIVFTILDEEAIASLTAKTLQELSDMEHIFSCPSCTIKTAIEMRRPEFITEEMKQQIFERLSKNKFLKTMFGGE